MTTGEAGAHAPLLVVCALEAELHGWVAPAGVVVVACGVGPVEAAACTARQLASAPYCGVVNAGIAGAFPGRAAVGDGVLVGTETYADFGLEGDGALTLPGGYVLPERVAADAAALVAVATGQRVVAGLTVAQVTATRATGERLAARYDADVESMEGFAVLRAAALAGVPALEVRGISNYVGERADSAWDFAAGRRATLTLLDAVVRRFPRSTRWPAPQ